MPLPDMKKQCTARSKRTGVRCQNPAVNGYNVCRHHGANPKNRGGRPKGCDNSKSRKGGAPKDNANSVRHGVYSSRLPPEEREEIHCNWQLQLTRRFPEQRTHVCFEALASCNEKRIRLWGRRYKWAGYVKSFQRILWPAFAEATRRALCLMHNNGLCCPLPILYKRLRAGPFKAGGIILMEHVGNVVSARDFLRSEFCLLSTKQQDEFLARVTSFIHSLHDLGIYGVKPRYLHGKHMHPSGEKTLIYLFDLDKVLLWTSCPSLIARMLCRKDYCRLLRELEPLLSRARLETVQTCLETGRACDGENEA